MTKERLKNIFIENKCIASDEWDNENPFVGIELDALNDILVREKQQWIENAAEWLKHNIYDYFYWIEMEGESEANIKDTLYDDFKKYAEEQL